MSPPRFQIAVRSTSARWGGTRTGFPAGFHGPRTHARTLACKRTKIFFVLLFFVIARLNPAEQLRM